jgi:endonuclease/exonuclease/phosphatase family metal-dependent hydrolase
VHRLSKLKPDNEKFFDQQLKILEQNLQQDGNIDILFLQEGIRGEDIARTFGMTHVFRIPKSLSWIISRHPIINSGKINFSGRRSMCGWADIQLQDTILRVFNIHLSSNQITTETENLMEEKNFQEPETWLRVGEVVTKYRSNSAIRAGEGMLIKSHIEQSEHPVIIAGDFNDVPQSYASSVIRKGLADSFVECGSGIGVTYAGKIPGLRIDYILCDENFMILDHEVKKENFSDHYPVFSRIVIK